MTLCKRACVVIFGSVLIWYASLWTGGRYMERRGLRNGFRAGYKVMADQAVSRGFGAWAEHRTTEGCSKSFVWADPQLLPISRGDE